MSQELFDVLHLQFQAVCGILISMITNLTIINLFTRPRRFGKSLNIDTLKTFFDIGADTSYFEGLEIMQETGLREKYMGKFPVISITLKDVNGLTYGSAVKKLQGGSILGKQRQQSHHTGYPLPCI